MTHIINLAQDVFIAFYLLVLFFLCLYGLHRYQLIILFHRCNAKAPVTIANIVEWPKVTVQLPIFNERYVVRRLLRTAAALDYPKAQLEIQILDDSTDETSAIAQELADKIRRSGLAVQYLHRTDREGYKATGEYIAIFDADFAPDPQFLRKALPYFYDSRVGMVQARWGYLNRGYSLLTRLQAIYLDAHFIIEHFVRNRSGRFFNFNGTAGIWRKQCLISAGGWEADTLTEDLDISYRAQLMGWKFVFVPELVAPSELPVHVTAFKTQQYRWAKGSIETAFKLLGSIFASAFPWKVKLEAFFHLTNNTAYLLMIFLSLSMYPSMIIRYNMGWKETIWLDVPLLLSATLSVTLFYITSQKVLYQTRWYQYIWYVPFLMGLGIGISLNNGKAVLSALLKSRSEFMRTPKHGIEGRTSKQQAWQDRDYWSKIDLVIVGEILMAVYFAFAIYFALLNQIYIALPFLLLFQFGFAYVALISLSQAMRRLVTTRIALRAKAHI
jgi:cellulose synthase/poly-beta-1,6-N-acetylglucosamine synthase-like glycosyltransferase